MHEHEELFHEFILHPFIDTLHLVPFLLVTYLLLEWIEHKTNDKTEKAIQEAGKAGPIIGAVLGAFPQCGFSAAAATLYSGRVITMGTLIAVFLSTSDEMLPIFIAEQVAPSTIGKILLGKVIVGVVAGFAIDFIWRRIGRGHEPCEIRELCEREHCHCEATEGHNSIFMSALIHTVKISAFIFVIVVVLHAGMHLIGEESFASFVSKSPIFAIFASALVGLIPNCAASVVITELYLDGVIASGAMFAGLLSAAGVGLLVIFRTNRPLKRTLWIILVLWSISVIAGLLVHAIGITF